ncbi:MAG: fumarylacetoacetate hydrolase family protein [Clostridia bacterium]|nr:fumarylacetoacetate hydrolase family protein [Clostridia bacterium]
MLLGRFAFQDQIFNGIVQDNQVLPQEGFKSSGTTLALEELKILPPCQPSKIIGVGLNYQKHIQELDFSRPEQPVLFFKPPTALIGSGEQILLPSSSSQVEYEGELAVVIGALTNQVSIQEAENYILGYTIANDVTARDLQKKDGQWTRSKSFNTFLPLGPFIQTELNPQAVTVKTFLNGELRQNGNTRNLIFSVAELVSFISNIMTLLPGDVIITGTPAGVGVLQSQDLIEVEIAGIGRLKNRVR